MIELWDLWFPHSGATGLSFARCRVGADAAADRVLVHAAPPALDVTVRDEHGAVLAEAGGVRAEAARRLGMDRTTLYRLMRKYGMLAPGRDE